MTRYMVTTRRALRGRVPSALEAMRTFPSVQIIDARDPEMIHVEVSDELAAQLKAQLADTHFVDRETHHRLH